ncbi:hypothetical protein [Leifsonia sp. fls2-241-R2A-40a]|uniref:hypothetical protein n=1 Tax=Leifsonia sp. fls2-241-R2A-40a TaxID=3040290 RepID=UPI00254ABFDF|nr:hypothetical protein [Leifsonia sp. fls2-241-R2A-40a]
MSNTPSEVHVSFAARAQAAAQQAKSFAAPVAQSVAARAKSAVAAQSVAGVRHAHDAHEPATLTKADVRALTATARIAKVTAVLAAVTVLGMIGLAIAVLSSVQNVGY